MGSSNDGMPSARRPREQPARASAQARELLAKVVGLLGVVVTRLRTPLLVVLLAPVIAGLALVAVTLLRGGPDVAVVVVIVAVAWIPAAWLAVRRRQLIRAVSHPEDAAVELSAVFGPGPVWDQLRENLTTAVSRRTNLRSLGRTIWRGVKVSTGLASAAADSPVLAPFFPGRLRGLVLLSAACLASFAALVVLLIVKSLTALLGVG